MANEKMIEKIEMTKNIDIIKVITYNSYYTAEQL